MYTDWMTPYRAVQREQDPAKQPELCEKARRAINDRLLELAAQGADPDVREELERCLRLLTLRDRTRTAPAVPRITDLSEEDRKSAQKGIKATLRSLRDCERYLRDYAEGTQNLFKLFGLIYDAQRALDQIQDDLAKKHKLYAPPKDD
jgi:hypothetical protein